MRSSSSVLHSLLVIAVAAAATSFLTDAAAREAGGGAFNGKPVAGHPGTRPSLGGSPIGHQGIDRGWRGARDNGWRGGRDDGWRGSRDDGWRGGQHDGWRAGRHDGRRYGRHHPRWAPGIGVGSGLGWPWWGWPYDAYPYGYPVGVVSEGSPPIFVNPEPMRWDGPSAVRWYCPAAAYYPDVKDCSQPWLNVLPQDAGPSSPPMSPNGPTSPPQSAPRSSMPTDEPEPTSPQALDKLGSASTRVRIVAPRITPPPQIARDLNVDHQTLAHHATP